MVGTLRRAGFGMGLLVAVALLARVAASLALAPSLETGPASTSSTASAPTTTAPTTQQVELLRLYEQLNAPPPAGEEAIKSLVTRWKNGGPEWQAALDDPDARVRRAACIAMQGHPEGLPDETFIRLAPRLMDQDPVVLDEAGKALRGSGPLTETPILELLNDHGVSNRVAILRYLQLDVRRTGPSVLGGIINALSDRSARVRFEALGALYREKPSAAIPAVLPLLKDNDVNVRVQAARVIAVAPIADAKSRDETIEALQATLHDKETPARAAMVAALGARTLQTGLGPEIAEALKDPEPRVRQIAETLLLRGNIDRVVGDLVRLTGASAAPTRAAALRVLGRVSDKDEAAGLAVAASLRDFEPTVRVAALESISLVRSAPDLPCQVAAMSWTDPDAQARITALAGLRRIGPRLLKFARSADPAEKRAWASVIASFKNTSLPVRLAAAMALAYANVSPEGAINVMVMACEQSDVAMRDASGAAMRDLAATAGATQASFKSALRAALWDSSGAPRPEVLAALPADPDIATPELFELLKKQLLATDARTRDAAAANYARFGQKIDPQMVIDALRDDDAATRVTAAEALGAGAPEEGNLTRFRTPLEAQGPLTRALADPRYDVSRAAAAALARIRMFNYPAAAPDGTAEQNATLLACAHDLDDASGSVRRRAIEDALAVGSPSTWCVPRWHAMLTDPDATVRLAANHAILKAAAWAPNPIRGTPFHYAPLVKEPAVATTTTMPAASQAFASTTRPAASTAPTTRLAQAVTQPATRSTTAATSRSASRTLTGAPTTALAAPTTTLAAPSTQLFPELAPTTAPSIPRSSHPPVVQPTAPAR